MVNLIDNAVKFTPINGAVVIKVEDIKNNLVIKVFDERPKVLKNIILEYLKGF